MAIGSLMRTRPTGAEPLREAQRLPTDFGGLVSSAYDNAMLNNRFTSERSLMRQVQDETYAPLIDRAKAEITGFDENKLATKAGQYFALKKSKALGDRYARNDTEARYAAMADEFEPHGWDVPLYSATEAEAANRANMTYEQFLEDQHFSVTNSPKWAMFFGEAGAALSDPAQLSAMIAATPVAASTRVLASMAIEGGINTAIDLPLLLTQRGWYAKQGREMTNDDIALQLAFSFGLGAGIGGLVSGLYRATGGTGTDFLPSAGGDIPSVGSYLPALTQGDLMYRQERPAWMTEADAADARLNAANARNAAQAYNTSSDAVTGPYPGDQINVAYGVDPVPSPYSQSMDSRGLTDALYGATINDYTPSITQTVNELADMGRHEAYKPYRGSNLAYDDFTARTNNPFSMYWMGAKLDEDHAANVKDAVEALYRGEAPTVPQKDALTAAMVVDDVPSRLGDVDDLVSGDIPISMRSKPYRDWINTKVRSIMGPYLERQVEKARSQFPEDRKPLKPEVDKPKLSTKQIAERTEKLAPKQKKITEARKKLRTDEAKTGRALTRRAKEEQKSITAAREQLRKDRARAKTFGKKWSAAQAEGTELKTPKDIYTVEQLNARQKELDARAEKLKTEKSGEGVRLPKDIRNVEKLDAARKALDDKVDALAQEKQALKDAAAAIRAYEAEVVRVSAINDAMRLEADLNALNKGEIPSSLTHVQKRLNDHYVALKDSGALRASAMDAGAAMRIKGMLGTPTSIRDAMQLTSLTKIETPKESAAVLDAMMIEIRASDVNLQTLVPDGLGGNRVRTIQDELDDIEAVDSLSDAVGVCGL